MNDRPSMSQIRDYAGASVFRPEAMLGTARRQKRLPEQDVPAVCLLDPDGDIGRHLRSRMQTTRHLGWACYHTELDVFELDGQPAGLVCNAVGGPFAVLVAEQLFASGCLLLISITSAGRIAALASGPHFLLLDRALRDEGTSQHYLPPAAWAEADPALADAAFRHAAASGVMVGRGAAWTTDAPFRETEAGIAAARDAGAAVVEMETASLYAFAAARHRPVLCFAHVTNELGQGEDDFDKGHAEGVHDALAVAAAAAQAWRELPIR